MKKYLELGIRTSIILLLRRTLVLQYAQQHFKLLLSIKFCVVNF